MWQFSHEEVKNGLIFFVPDPKRLAGVTRGVRDSFDYRLVAPAVQPAKGTFEFTVVSKVIVKPMDEPESW